MDAAVFLSLFEIIKFLLLTFSAAHYIIQHRKAVPLHMYQKMDETKMQTDKIPGNSARPAR